MRLEIGPEFRRSGLVVFRDAMRTLKLEVPEFEFITGSLINDISFYLGISQRPSH